MVSKALSQSDVWERTWPIVEPIELRPYSGNLTLRGVFLLGRITHLAIAAIVAMVILMLAALAQDAAPGDDDSHSPEPNAVAVDSHEELERIAGRPVPSPDPGQHPEPVPAAPSQGLPKTGGPSLTAILPAAALLLVGSGVLTYAALRKRRGIR